MSTAQFSSLFRWELRNIPRRPLLWVIVGILFASFLWGAMNAAELGRSQESSIALTLNGDAEIQRDLNDKVQRYAHPGGPKLQYWQDPTDINGFSRYFLVQHAVKPLLPLAPLSVGQSDLLPFIYPMRLETPFGVEPTYDFVHPRALTLGIFDLSFSVVYFLPIGVILLVSMIGAFERDHGILRLAAAQPVSPRLLLGTKLAALAVWLVPALLLSVVAALAIAGKPLLSDLAGLLVALVAITGYTAFWFMLGFLVLSHQRGAATTASMLIAVWAMLAIVVPKVATLALSVLAPQNSYVLYVNQLRHVEDDVMRPAPAWDDNVRSWLATRPEHHAREVDVPNLTYAAHLVFAAEARERALQQTVDEMHRNRAESGRWTPVVEALSPPAALQNALSTIAGTDPRRSDRFVEAVRSHQLDLRGFVYPLVKRQIVDPRVSPCALCPGALTFNDYAHIPQFRFPPTSLGARIGPALLWSGFFSLLAALFCMLGIRRGAAWRAGELQ